MAAARGEFEEAPAACQPADPEGFDPGRHQEEIARVAYALWEERGRTHGSHEEDWRRAEAEVRRRYASGA